MAIRFRRLSGMAFVISLLALVGAPWILYTIALSSLDGRPNPPRDARPSSAQLELLRAELRVPGDLVVPKLSPWKYALTVVDSTELPRETLAAWIVARDHNSRSRRGNLSWHLCGAALTVWLTRNWASEQILVRAAELLEPHRKPSNSALEPTAASVASSAPAVVATAAAAQR
jgi:hypothetical protein